MLMIQMPRARSCVTIPSSWYIDTKTSTITSSRPSFQIMATRGARDQLREPGQVRHDGHRRRAVGSCARERWRTARAFFNVCRHHAAAVMTEPEGKAAQLRCPYHGWTYSLEGELKGTPDFSGVCEFDRANNGLVIPVESRGVGELGLR